MDCRRSGALHHIDVIWRGIPLHVLSLAAPCGELVLDQVQRLFHVGDDDVHAHDVAGVHHLHVHQAQPALDLDAGAAADKVVIYGNNADADPVAVRRRNDGAQLGRALRFLCDHDEVDVCALQHLVELVRRAQVPRHRRVGAVLQVAGVAQLLRAPLHDVLQVAFGGRAAAEHQHAGGQVPAARMGGGQPADQLALGQHRQRRQQVKVPQQQAGKLL